MRRDLTNVVVIFFAAAFLATQLARGGWSESRGVHRNSYARGGGR